MEYKILFDRQAAQWQIPPDAERRYFKATDDWEELGHSTVECTILGKICDSEGTILNTEELKFYCDRPGGANANDPSLYENDILPWGHDNEGRLVVLGNYLWSQVGEIRMTTTVANLLTGWHQCDGNEGTVDFTGEEGRFAKHHAADVAGDRGGFKLHGSTENNHTSHDNHTHQIDNAGSDEVDAGTDGTAHALDSRGNVITSGIVGPVGVTHHDDSDNRPPYTTVIFIERYK